MTPAQCRAARALIGMSQKELASMANVGAQTLADFERGARVPRINNLNAMQTALEEAGVEFIPENGGGVGVRLRK
ncbi:Helix-turn-helix [Pseudovibrio ascidiaceicola]|uniref:Helix-turn-helix n=1 Tax=Pseudovibrio ascidiaceicola TaxID=285279 RepID=A0A1I3Z0U6_9HYPH|nr:Helix-turn-helix [Pseudovibrio ascidiaceicola]